MGTLRHHGLSNFAIDEELDFVSIIKLQNKNVFEEETLGTDEKPSESLFL